VQSVEALRKASFITPDQWNYWLDSTPKGKGAERRNYLALSDGPCGPALIRAITSRWVALYKEWYEELRIGTLF
jgi:hypothetical protein